MATQTVALTAHKIVTPETLCYAAKLYQPIRFLCAIKKYLRELEEPYMKRKALSLSHSFNDVKNANLKVAITTSREIVEDPLKSFKSSYGDIGPTCRDEETTYVASRMPAVYSSCYRVLKVLRSRFPCFSLAKVLDFGAGTSSAFWSLQEVGPKSLGKVNLIELSQSMQRAGQNLMQEDSLKLQQADDDAPGEVLDMVTRDSDDAMETDGGGAADNDKDEGEEETASADHGGCGRDRTIFMPVKKVGMNEFRSTIVDTSEGPYDCTTLQQADDAPGQVVDTVSHDSDDAMDGGGAADDDKEEWKEETASADLGVGWDGIIFKPAKRVRQVTNDSDAMETGGGADVDNEDAGEAGEWRSVKSDVEGVMNLVYFLPADRVCNGYNLKRPPMFSRPRPVLDYSRPSRHRPRQICNKKQGIANAPRQVVETVTHDSDDAMAKNSI